MWLFKLCHGSVEMNEASVLGKIDEKIPKDPCCVVCSLVIKMLLIRLVASVV